MIRRTIASLLLPILFAGSGFGQSKGKVPSGGTEYFRFGLHLNDIKPLASQEEALASPESSMVRTYLDWLIAVPWSKRSEERLEPVAARQVLDEDHAAVP